MEKIKKITKPIKTDVYDKFELDYFQKAITAVFPNIDVYVRKNKKLPIIEIKLLPEDCSKEKDIVNDFKDMEMHPQKRLKWKCSRDKNKNIEKQLQFRKYDSVTDFILDKLHDMGTKYNKYFDANEEHEDENKDEEEKEEEDDEEDDEDKNDDEDDDEDDEDDEDDDEGWQDMKDARWDYNDVIDYYGKKTKELIYLINKFKGSG